MANENTHARTENPRVRDDDTLKSPRDIVSIARGFETAMLVTHGGGSALRARPMSVAKVEDDARLWFVTSMESEKLEEIAKDPRAIVVMQGRTTHLAIEGRATTSYDRRKLDELWSDAMRVWFTGPDDPSIVLIEFRSDEAEYWDFSGAKGIKLAFRAVKAALGGEPLGREDAGENHGKVRL